LRNGSSRTTTNDPQHMDLARHLSLEPHDDSPELTAVERRNRQLLRFEYEAWRLKNPFDDVLDFALHVARTQKQGGWKRE